MAAGDVIAAFDLVPRDQAAKDYLQGLVEAWGPADPHEPEEEIDVWTFQLRTTRDRVRGAVQLGEPLGTIYVLEKAPVVDQRAV